MASSLCLVSTCCQHLSLTPKLFLNKSFKANKFNSIICASSIRRNCILKAKRSGDEGDQEKKERKVRILIAGGGVGGLVLALAAKQRGFEVMVFEKDLSAVRGEGRHRGPIQLLSSALGVLDGIDKDLVDKIIDAGCVTGNRINGLADGLTGNCYDAKTKTGGPNGSIRNQEEYKHGANSGLKIAIELCEEVKAQDSRVTYADLYCQLQINWFKHVGPFQSKSSFTVAA